MGSSRVPGESARRCGRDALARLVHDKHRLGCASRRGWELSRRSHALAIESCQQHVVDGLRVKGDAQLHGRLDSKLGHHPESIHDVHPKLSLPSLLSRSSESWTIERGSSVYRSSTGRPAPRAAPGAGRGIAQEHELTVLGGRISQRLSWKRAQGPSGPRSRGGPGSPPCRASAVASKAQGGGRRGIFGQAVVGIQLTSSKTILSGLKSRDTGKSNERSQ